MACVRCRRSVADVMTEEPLVVRPETNMAAAAKILLDMKVNAALQLARCIPQSFCRMMGRPTSGLS